MCGSSDNSKGTITGYASSKVCVKGGDASTAGAFSTTVAGCTASDTNKMAAQCTCVAGQNGDAAAGAFCVSVSSTNKLFAACAAGSALSAECMCGSSDNSKGTISGYASGKLCTKGSDASTVGAFSTTLSLIHI